MVSGCLARWERATERLGMERGGERERDCTPKDSEYSVCFLSRWNSDESPNNYRVSIIRSAGPNRTKLKGSRRNTCNSNGGETSVTQTI